MFRYSIIIPCYNIENRVDELVKMFFLQNRKDYEVIFVDDCSLDCTFLRLSEKLSSLPNMNVVQTSENGGPGLARNKGLEHARGEYILFCDSDDIADLSVLKCIDEFLCNKPDADLIVMPSFLKRNNKLTVIDFYAEYKNEDLIPATMIAKDAGVPWGRVYQKKIIDENNIKFPARMAGEDKCFVVTYLIHAKKIYKLDQIYYTYVMTSQSITHNRQEKDFKLETTFEILKPIYEQYFPEMIVDAFVNDHLLAKAKQMTEKKLNCKQIKNFFKQENKRYPNWIDKIDYKNQSLYRKLIYKAMYKNNAFCIKLIMWLRTKLY